MENFTRQPVTGQGAINLRKKSHWKLWLVLILLVFPVLVLIGYTWTTLHYAYASGERAGYVQKISTKGWLCKTWEGELAMTTVPGVAPQMFLFSVRDANTARQIAEVTGQRVALSYEQHKGVPGSCFAETEYFVTAVRAISQ